MSYLCGRVLTVQVELLWLAACSYLSSSSSYSTSIIQRFVYNITKKIGKKKRKERRLVVVVVVVVAYFVVWMSLCVCTIDTRTKVITIPSGRAKQHPC